MGFGLRVALLLRVVVFFVRDVGVTFACGEVPTRLSCFIVGVVA